MPALLYCPGHSIGRMEMLDDTGQLSRHPLAMRSPMLGHGLPRFILLLIQ